MDGIHLESRSKATAAVAALLAAVLLGSACGGSATSQPSQAASGSSAGSTAPSSASSAETTVAVTAPPSNTETAPVAAGAEPMRVDGRIEMIYVPHNQAEEPWRKVLNVRPRCDSGVCSFDAVSDDKKKTLKFKYEAGENGFNAWETNDRPCRTKAGKNIPLGTKWRRQTWLSGSSGRLQGYALTTFRTPASARKAGCPDISRTYFYQVFGRVITPADSASSG